MSVFFFLSWLRILFELGKPVIPSLACFMVKNLSNGKKEGRGKEEEGSTNIGKLKAYLMVAMVVFNWFVMLVFSLHESRNKQVVRETPSQHSWAC